MNRKVLLVEPNYKNRYPPMGLMKLATYFRACGDDVVFFKGNMKDLAARLVCSDLLKFLECMRPDVFWKNYYPKLFEYIRKGKFASLEGIEDLDDDLLDVARDYRRKYMKKDFFEHPRFDKVGITTLFTFHWTITIDTINFAKQLCKKQEDVMVGGIMSSILPDEVYEATGIRPFVGQLDRPGLIDKDNDLVIDQLPLDYSILEEIDYVYPTHDAYFSYMTRGCVNRCKFCAVPQLEPQYRNYIGLKSQVEATDKRFGQKRDLMLLDNNVLASECFDKIIDEIIECGFGKDASQVRPSEYDVAIQNLRDAYNDRAYVRKAIKIYQDTINRLKNAEERSVLYQKLKESHCLHDYTACKESILALDEYFRPLYEKTHRPTKRRRIIDFNQGIDARLINENNIKRLAELNIYPLRIAFDHWSQHEIYTQAVKLAVSSDIGNLSNYLLYNFNDKPEELYYRLRVNVDLCEELDANIYSFPMKYHPIDAPAFFKNRDYIGKYWSRKFIRAVQAILNSTKGKVGRGVEFFEQAFGKDVDEYFKLLWMPETFIVYRRKYDENLRMKVSSKYQQSSEGDNNLANEWWEEFSQLDEQQLAVAKTIIAANRFAEDDYSCDDPQIERVIAYYRIDQHH